MAYTPRDKYNAVWLIFFMLGLGTLLPWNFFMTATAYFTSRLKDTTMENSRIEGFRDIQSTLEAKFNNVMTLCSMIPLLAFTCLNSFLHGLIPQKFRVMGSLIVILVVFLITAIIVKVDMEPIPFFSLTMIKIVIINSFGAILQGSLFGMAGLLPTKYTTPIMSGQGLAGTFAAFSMICAIASGSEIQDAAFGYFLTACAVIGLTIVCYAVLPRLEFYQFYQPSNIDRGPCDEESATDSTDPPKTDTGPVKEKTGTVEITIEPVETNTRPKVSMIAIFKKIWWLALSVCFTFTVTIGIFPAITADVKSTVANEGSWEVYFIPVSCFLLFNISDWIGRSLTAGCMFPGKDSILLPGSVEQMSTL